MYIYMCLPRSLKNPYSTISRYNKYNLHCYEFNKIVRRSTQKTVRNKHSFSVIRATIAFYIAIQLDEYFKLTLGSRAH